MSETARKKPPSVRARVRGQLTAMRKYAEEQYKEKNPGKKIRWVFDPEHNRTLSKVRLRQLEGYELIDGEVEEIDFPHGQQGTAIRLGDTVMMAIDEDEYQERKDELDALAREDARKSKEAYEEAMRSVSKGGHESRPVGDVSDRSVEFTVKETEE